MHSNAFATDSMTTSNISDVARSLSIISHPKRKATELSVIPNLKKKKEHAHLVQPCPRSLSVTAMMKLGTAISTAAAPPVSIEVSQFDMDQLRWSAPIIAHFDIARGGFARGGFRAAFKSTSKTPPFKGGTTYIIKFYHPGTLTAISEVNDSTEDHARKSVQMHVLAKNFADQITVQVAKEQKQEVFGKTFSYVDAFLGKIEGTGEIVTIEEFAGEGSFCKYVNNNGAIAVGNDPELQGKAESLVHFSFAKSKKKLMVVDIQGSGYNLSDPENATVGEAFDETKKLLFCVGNLSDHAYYSFFDGHACNLYCNLLGLEDECTVSNNTLK